MLTFRDLLNFPPQFSHREIPKIDEVEFISCKIEEDDKGQAAIILYKIRDYDVVIQIFIDDINQPPPSDGPVKIFCTCKSFQYDFAPHLYRAGQLFSPEYFFDPVYQDQLMLRPPRIRNVERILSGCKHIIACARWTQGKSISKLVKLSETTRHKYEKMIKIWFTKYIKGSASWFRKMTSYTKNRLSTIANMLKI